MVNVSISQVVLATGLTERQIRYCESRGFINPQRTSGGHRLYNEANLLLLMSLAEQRKKGQSLTKAMQVISSTRGRRQTNLADDSMAVQLFFGLTPKERPL